MTNDSSLSVPAVATKLRHLARERMYADSLPADQAPLSAADAQRLVHELKAQKIEWEIQRAELKSTLAQLAAATKRYSDLYEAAPVGYVTLGRTGAITQSNQTAARTLRTERDRLIGRRFGAFITEADQNTFNDFLLRVFSGQIEQTCEVRLLISAVPPTIHLHGTLSDDALECRIVVLDITERKNDEEALRLAASVFMHAREGIMITDAKAKILQVNDAFTSVTGYCRDEAIGQIIHPLKSARQSPEFFDAIQKALAEQGHWYGEVWNRRKNGEMYAEMLSISAVRNAAGETQNYVVLLSDITSQKEHQQQLEHIAHYDTLTDLPNRVLLADRLHQDLLRSQRRGQMLAVVYLDLDGFKQINDKHGHSVGDELLIRVSQNMKAALREGDTLARVGGDEFVAVLVDLEGKQDCQMVLERLLVAASQTIEVNHATLAVSASIGVALYPQDGLKEDQLLRQSDQAMYLAKEAGKNRLHFFDATAKRK